jgi:hypothetical protein
MIRILLRSGTWERCTEKMFVCLLKTRADDRAYDEASPGRATGSRSLHVRALEREDQHHPRERRSKLDR